MRRIAETAQAVHQRISIDAPQRENCVIDRLVMPPHVPAELGRPFQLPFINREFSTAGQVDYDAGEMVDSLVVAQVLCKHVFSLLRIAFQTGYVGHIGAGVRHAVEIAKFTGK